MYNHLETFQYYVQWRSGLAGIRPNFPIFLKKIFPEWPHVVATREFYLLEAIYSVY